LSKGAIPNPYRKNLWAIFNDKDFWKSDPEPREAKPKALTLKKLKDTEEASIAHAATLIKRAPRRKRGK
jgi:hypothetical protein